MRVMNPLFSRVLRLISNTPEPVAPLIHPVHVVASPFKTGTSSIAQALLELGVGSSIMPYDHGLLKSYSKRCSRWNRLARKSEDFATFASLHGADLRDDLGGLISALRPYDIFHDAPFGHTHLHLFVRRVIAPEARFIWVMRAKDDWLASVRNWEMTHPDTYPNHNEWIEDPERKRAKKIAVRNKAYRAFVTFKQSNPDRCLELGWRGLSNWSALAAFYDKPVPDRPFPRVNASRR